MIKKYNRIGIVLILSICLLLTGCWDYRDVDKRSIVIFVGVDRVKKNIEFSSELARIIPDAGGKGQKAQLTNVYKDISYGKNFEEARIDFNSRRPNPTFLGATRVVVFGQNFAKESIEPYLNRINKMYDYRKTLLAVVSREPPSELFKTKVENDISVGFLIENNINFLAKKGSALYTTIGRMLSDIALGEVGYVLPYVGVDKDQIKYLGLAVMKDSKLVDVINVKDTDGLLYLLSENPRLMEDTPSPKNLENTFSFRTTIKNRKIKTRYIDKKPVIDIYLELNGELQYQYFMEPISDAEINEVENMISEKVKNDIINIIKKSQEDYKCDIFDFAKYFRADNPKIYEEIKWSQEYLDADVNVVVKSKIINKNLSDPNAEKNK